MGIMKRLLLLLTLLFATIPAKANWNYDLEKIRNIIDYKSYILKIRNITFVHNKKDTK